MEVKNCYENNGIRYETELPYSSLNVCVLAQTVQIGAGLWRPFCPLSQSEKLMIDR